MIGLTIIGAVGKVYIYTCAPLLTTDPIISTAGTESVEGNRLPRVLQHMGGVRPRFRYDSGGGGGEEAQGVLKIDCFYHTPPSPKQTSTQTDTQTEQTSTQTDTQTEQTSALSDRDGPVSQQHAPRAHRGMREEEARKRRPVCVRACACVRARSRRGLP